MGTDKARIRLGSQTMLSLIKRQGHLAGFQVRVIRLDTVPRCGPLGGLLTGLASSRCAGELFLACDMPFISVELLRQLNAIFRAGCERAIFVSTEGRPGFPCLLPRAAEELIRSQIEQKTFSLGALCDALKARRLRISAGRAARELVNVNTPADLERARARVASTKRPGCKLN